MEPLTDFQHPEFALAIHQVIHAKQRDTLLVINGNGLLRDGLQESLGSYYPVLEAHDNAEGLAMVNSGLAGFDHYGFGSGLCSGRIYLSPVKET